MLTLTMNGVPYWTGTYKELFVLVTTIQPIDSEIVKVEDHGSI